MDAKLEFSLTNDEIHSGGLHGKATVQQQEDHKEAGIGTFRNGTCIVTMTNWSSWLNENLGVSTIAPPYDLHKVVGQDRQEAKKGPMLVLALESCLIMVTLLASKRRRSRAKYFPTCKVPSSQRQF
jgi:hypothetical protein